MLLEREEPLLALEAALGRIRASGTGELGTVAGEAGVGKSSLLRAVAARITPGATILWGACDALRTPRPLGPLLDLAPTAGPALQAAVVQNAPRETRPRPLPVLAPRVAGIDWSGGCAGRRRGLPLARRTAVLALATTSATLLLQRVPVRYPTGVLTGSIAPVGYRIRPSLSSLYRDNRCHSTLRTRLIAIRAAIHRRRCGRVASALRPMRAAT